MFYIEKGYIRVVFGHMVEVELLDVETDFHVGAYGAFVVNGSDVIAKTIIANVINSFSRRVADDMANTLMGIYLQANDLLLYEECKFLGRVYKWLDSRSRGVTLKSDTMRWFD